MSAPLRILHLEDSAGDAALVEALLADGGLKCEIVRVESREAFEQALSQDGRFDVIISDFSLPSFDGLSALSLARERLPETPFIFVSGTMGEEHAVQTLRHGATDYIIKNRLVRLPAAVLRALDEARQRADHKRLEEQFRQAQKMEALGQLAGGVAHDFNNLLMVITGYSELLLGQLAADSPARASVEQIRQAGQRASGLTRQLLAFTRREVVQPQVLSLNEVVARAEGLLRRVIGEDVDLVTNLEPDLHAIKADAGQIEQVILNLAVNARDAMPQGGRLTIETHNVREGPGRPVRGGTPGSFVSLVVSDTGSGIDEATQAKMFEPFFTTKPAGKGTGLGLATVSAVLKQCQGEVVVESVVGTGTTFRLYFPRTDERPGLPSEPSAETLPGRRETILVVEDEPGVRNVIREALEGHGYQILEARHGLDALVLTRQPDLSIDLVLTDVVMPQMSGRELVEHLRRERPSLKVLYMSGYIDDARIREGLSTPGAHFIQKPFTVGSLLARLRQVLEER